MIAKEMTPSQIAEAQKMARECEKQNLDSVFDIEFFSRYKNCEQYY